MKKPSLHSTFYLPDRPCLPAGRQAGILHSILILALLFMFSSQTVFAQEPAPGANGDAAAAEQAEEAKKPAPSIIPCPKNLPCIQPATQAKGASAIREHVIGKWAVTVLTGFLGLAAATAVIFIIVGGLQMHLAFGNDEAVGTAKKTLTWAVVGLVIAILSVAIVRIISSISL